MGLGNKEIMAANIKRYMELNKVTASEICTKLNFPHNTFSDWTKAKTYPRIDKIEMMANFFHISKADLVEEHSFNSESNKRDAQLLLSFHKLTPEHQEVVFNMISSLIASQKS